MATCYPPPDPVLLETILRTQLRELLGPKDAKVSLEFLLQAVRKYMNQNSLPLPPPKKASPASVPKVGEEISAAQVNARKRNRGQRFSHRLLLAPLMGNRVMAQGRRNDVSCVRRVLACTVMHVCLSIHQIVEDRRNVCTLGENCPYRHAFPKELVDPGQKGKANGGAKGGEE